jgi:ATP-dependent Clp protease, protease subunit
MTRKNKARYQSPARNGMEELPEEYNEDEFETEEDMIHPRTLPNGKLVSCAQMVSPREHLAGQHRLINVFGELGWELDSTNLMLAFDSMAEAPIKLLISSPGGSLDAAFQLVDTYKLLRSPVYTLGTWVCSAAVLLLASGSKRYLMPHSKTMLHLPSAKMSGDAKDLAIQGQQFTKYKEQMVKILQDCGVKKSQDEILADIDREFWMNPQEAIDYGLADAIMDKDTMQEWLK